MPIKTDNHILADMAVRFGDGDWQALSTDIPPVSGTTDTGDEFIDSAFACESIECRCAADMLKFHHTSMRRDWLRGKTLGGTSIRCIHNRHNKRKRIQKKWDKKYGAMYCIVIDGPFSVTREPDGSLTYEQQRGNFGLSFNTKEELWEK